MKKIQIFFTLVALLTLSTAAMAQDQQDFDIPDKPPTDPDALAAFDERGARSEVARVEMNKLWFKSDYAGAAKAGEKILTTFVFPFDRVMLARIYSRLNKPDDVIRVIKPALYPVHHTAFNVDKSPDVRMLYVLALLDKHEWAKAVEVYEPTIDSQSSWKQRPTQPDIQKVPTVHFNPDQPDYGALYAQAHLILGVIRPLGSTRFWTLWEIYHLQQAVIYKPGLSVAHYYAGLHLIDLQRNAEARAEFQSAARTASPSELTEIQTALKNLNEKEAMQRDIEARKAAEQSTP